jgi:hypothetical protein
MPENMDESLLSAIERYKNGQESPDDLKIIRQALISKQIIIVQVNDPKINTQSGGADFGESNEIRVTGSVIGTQSLSGFSTDQVVELLRLYDSTKDSGLNSVIDEPKKKKRRNIKKSIYIAIYGLIAFIAAFLAGIYFADLAPPINSQNPVLATVLALIPSTGATDAPMIPTPIWTPTLVPTSTHKLTPASKSSQTFTLTPPPTNTQFPTKSLTPTRTFTKTPTPTLIPTKTLTSTLTSAITLTSTPSPTNTPTPTPEVIFTDTFDDYQYSTNIGWNLFTEEEGKIYRRRITRNKIDNKFEHSVNCLSQTCVGRNKIPRIAEYQNFILSFDIEYLKISPTLTDLSRPIICIYFRQYDPRNFYALCFNSNGWYRIARYVNGELAIIKDWERTPVLNRGLEKNSIRLTANRSIYLFKANGTEIADFEDGNLLGAGNIEIVIYSFQDIAGQKSEVILEIDNVEIINLP